MLQMWQRAVPTERQSTDTADTAPFRLTLLSHGKQNNPRLAVPLRQCQQQCSGGATPAAIRSFLHVLRALQAQFTPAAGSGAGGWGGWAARAAASA